MLGCFGGVRIAGALVVVCTAGVAVVAQAPGTQKQAPKVERASTVPITSIEGRDNFLAYCAVCHGKDGKGHGPAAPAMKVPVPDLTTIAKRNSDKFSPADVRYVITGTGKQSTPAHGVEEMPIWGDVFRFEDRGQTILRINNLVKYLKSIQQTGTESASR